jgi:hypoxanthine phosphoribosyltransferase
MTIEEANAVFADADILATEKEVAGSISWLAAEITARLQEKRPLVLCVMNGGMIFAGQLLTKLVFPLEVGYVHATRYGAETSGGTLNWLATPPLNIAGRTVLLLDDILDEGVTLAEIAQYCRNEGAAEVLTAVLIDKLHNRKAFPGCKADFTGIRVEDRFLFGYGLDYKGYWRNAPGIYAVKGL